jgi:hypothetical protein
MDRFRVKALEKALHLPLTSDQEWLVKQEIVRKCQILVEGFRKRDKEEGAEEFLALIDKYRTGNQTQGLEG